MALWTLVTGFASAGNAARGTGVQPFRAPPGGLPAGGNDEHDPSCFQVFEHVRKPEILRRDSDDGLTGRERVTVAVGVRGRAGRGWRRGGVVAG
ncbi:hypothetical protein CcI6DRAFT_03931, partial [Frankia sp. CcI6]